MKRKSVFLVALASAMLATSCSTEDLPLDVKASDSKITVHPSIGSIVTRASESTTNNLQSFKTYSFLTGDDQMYMNGVTYAKSTGGNWDSKQGDFYWPVSGDLNFYSYAPEKPGESGVLTVTPSSQKLTGFTPYSTAATQQDFIYSKATGNLADNGKNGIDFKFNHALSEVIVKAKDANPDHTVKVTGVKLGNIKSSGDFTFPSASGVDASWSLGSSTTDYTTEWSTAVTLDADASTMDGSNTPFMLIPQQLHSEETASEGSCIAFKVNITQGGSLVYDGWTYVGIPTTWEMGNCYTYTVDFTNGFGQKPGGEPIINSKEIEVTVSVTPWNNVEIELPLCISGHNLKNSEVNLNVGPGDVTVTMFDDNTWKYEVKGWKPSDLHFWNMMSLESVNLSSLDASNITDMSQMFMEHEDLKTVKMKGINFSGVKDMSGMFKGCKSLTDLDLFGYASLGATNMNSMFEGCTSLTSASTWSWYTGANCEMLRMFCGCTSLNNAMVDVNNASTLNSMFNGCTALKSVRIDRLSSSVSSMSYMFHGCAALTDVSINIYSTYNLKYLTSMFGYCESLERLSLNSLVQGNVTDMSYMFHGCKSLKNLYFPNWNTAKVTDMSAMFQGCKSLTSLNYFQNWDTGNVYHMDYMFRDCSSLTTLNLSGWNTANVTNISQMFEGCSSLTTLDLSGWNTTSVNNWYNAFNGCTSLKTIYMVGCDSATISLIEACLTQAGISTDIIKTKK